MNKSAKTIVAIMLTVVAVIVAGCSKPEAPNNGENDNVQNDSIVAHGDSLNVHDYVDLGLPSGTLWATCNVGADVPEGYGDYFAWGETAPKEAYDWNGYKYGNFVNDRYEFDKYCTDSVYGLNGFVDHFGTCRRCSYDQLGHRLANTYYGRVGRAAPKHHFRKGNPERRERVAPHSLERQQHLPAGCWLLVGWGVRLHWHRHLLVEFAQQRISEPRVGFPPQF